MDVHTVRESARSSVLDRGSITEHVTKGFCPSQSVVSRRRSEIVRCSEPRRIAPGGFCVGTQLPCYESRELVVMTSYLEGLWRLAL